MDKNLDLEYMELAKACGVDGSDWHNEILEFAYQVAKHEREECAALCSSVAAGRDAEAIEEAIMARNKS